MPDRAAINRAGKGLLSKSIWRQQAGSVAEEPDIAQVNAEEAQEQAKKTRPWRFPTGARSRSAFGYTARRGEASSPAALRCSRVTEA